MDKILITSFRDEIANAILNMQDKLNPNKDAYIDKNELKGVLDFFGVNDVSSLLKSEDSNSVFENASTNSQQQTNQDTIEFSKYEIDEDDAIDTYGTAANELNSMTKANLALRSAGVSYAQQLAALEREFAIKQSKNENVADVIYKIDELKDLVVTYMKEHPEADVDHLIIKKITYGKNGEKKAILSQSFGIKGNNSFDKNSVNNTDVEATESDKKNDASAEVNYNVDFRTLNGKANGDWHIRGTINAGSENSDIHGAVQYTKQFKNNGVLNFTGNIRETIKDKQNLASFGASVDYKQNKFSTGAYAMYSKEDDSKQSNFEVYGRYSKSIIASAGVESIEGANYYYASGMVEGKRSFENIGLSIHGGIGGEYGKNVATQVDNFSQRYLKARGKGGIAFKSSEFSADISADISKTQIKSTYDAVSYKTRMTTAAFVGNVSTKNINVSATVSSIKVDADKGAEESLQVDSKPSITASIIIGIKNIFGKNIMPILKYNVGNYDGASQSIGAGVIISP